MHRTPQVPSCNEHWISTDLYDVDRRHRHRHHHHRHQHHHTPSPCSAAATTITPPPRRPPTPPRRPPPPPRRQPATTAAPTNHHHHPLLCACRHKKHRVILSLPLNNILYFRARHFGLQVGWLLPFQVMAFGLFACCSPSNLKPTALRRPRTPSPCGNLVVHTNGVKKTRAGHHP